jgi:hypothetical protein
MPYSGVSARTVEAHMAGISFSPCRTMTAEDVCDLQCRARHASGRRRNRFEDLDEMPEMALPVSPR